MKFDETGKVSGVTRRRAREAQEILDRAKNVAEVAQLWISNADREVTVCNGVDDGEHFESLCVVLKEIGRHVAERYISLSRIEREGWDITPASRFVNWRDYHRAIETAGPQYIADFRDEAAYKAAVGIESVDPELGTPVLNHYSSQRVALSYGLSPFSEATFSQLAPEFFEGDKKMLRKWGKRSLLWLFTTLRSPFKVSGVHPGLVDSLVCDINRKPATKARNTLLNRNRVQGGTELYH